MTDLLLFGKALGQIRVERGLSVGELAAAAGIEVARVEALEAGQLDPGFKLLLALADGLGVGSSVLVTRAEELRSEPGV
jgi:transcriptional regulator with XRE-family HTH domain